MIMLTTIKLTDVFLLPCQDIAGPLQCQLYIALISDLKKSKFVLRKIHLPHSHNTLIEFA